uniref:transmembrane protein 268-like n=1 Tax=Myxine glutinosa TaxID=7769 RepID=UPI00358FEFC0
MEHLERRSELMVEEQSEQVLEGSGSSRVQETAALSNGHVIVLWSKTGRSWDMICDCKQVQQELDLAGVQVPLGDINVALSETIQDPQLRRLVVLLSESCSLLILLLFFVTGWCDISATIWHFSPNLDALSAAFLGLPLALGLTLSFAAISQFHSKKLNLSIDLRLAVSNEVLLRHHLLLGVLHSFSHCRSQLLVLESAVQTLQMRGDGLAKIMCSSQDHVTITVNSETVPLLSSQQLIKEMPLRTAQFVPQGTPQEQAKQLVLLYSGLYARLLAQGLLQRPPAMLHAPSAPCLCQFISLHLPHLHR